MVRVASILAGVLLANGAAAQAAAPTLLPAEADLTLLVFKAHPVVQAVMGLLVFALFIVLTVMFYKMGELAFARSRLRRSMAALSQGLGAPVGHCPLAHAARTASRELESLPVALSAVLRRSAQERLEIALQRIEAGTVQHLRLGTGLLASIGSVGPFVGLFGTVFGIMNSFLAISASKTTNLAVVAPGIAEALLATGLGLVAAIPAVLLYNHLMRRIKAHMAHLADGSARVKILFSRALDARMGA